MKKLKPSPTNSFVLILFFAIVLLAGNSQAALLGLDLGEPVIHSNSSGTYNYNAGTNLLEIDASSYYIDFGDGPTLFTQTGKYHAEFEVDESGHFVDDGNMDYDDFTITGAFTYDGINYGTDADSVLLKGEVVNFGWDNNDYDEFDFVFLIDPNCLLSSFYKDGLGGNITYMDSKNRTWSGDWTESHTDEGNVMANNTAPVPIPSAAFVLAVGMSGLVGVIRKKRA